MTIKKTKTKSNKKKMSNIPGITFDYTVENYKEDENTDRHDDLSISQYSKKYVDNFNADFEKCKDKNNVLDKYVFSFEPFINIWLFIKKFKMTILMILL